MIMFHNGSMKDNLNFKAICPLKQKEQSTRISYENDWGIYVYRSGEPMMEEHRFYSIKRALQNVGVFSQSCHNWEIYKLLFLLHNVKPVWMEVNITNDNVYYHKVFTIYVSSNLNTAILVDNRRGYQTGFLNYNFKCLTSYV